MCVARVIRLILRFIKVIEVIQVYLCLLRVTCYVFASVETMMWLSLLRLFQVISVFVTCSFSVFECPANHSR